MLIVAAIVVIYIVLGMLYESLVHPITVLSTLPSAGVGAVLALLLFRMEFSIIALIGVFLLIGIVKKNAILIIDFALEAERARGLSALEAVREACLLRFRPILMTTLAAALGALPLAIGFGEGAELRQPLGVAIIGGLHRQPAADPADDAGRLPAARQAAPARRRRAHLSRAGDAARPRPDRRSEPRRSTVTPPRSRLGPSRRRRSRPGLAGCAVGPRLPGARARRVPAAYKEAPADGGAPGCRRRRPTRSTAATGGRCSATRSSTALVAAGRASPTRTSPLRSPPIAQARALVREQRAALFPTLGARRQRAAQRRPRRRSSSPARVRACRSSASWEPDLWGRLRPRRRRARTASAAGERRRPRGGAPVGAGRAGDRLLLAARGRRRDRAARAHDRRLRARRCRSTRNRYDAGIVAKTDVLQAETQLASTRADSARRCAPARARSSTRSRCWSARAPADFSLARGAVDAGRAGGAARRAVGAAAAPARHRRGRARGRRRQCADRHPALGLLPEPDPERLARQRRLAHRRPVQRLEQRSGRSASRWRRRCSTPARRGPASAAAEAGARRRRRALPADRADARSRRSRTSSRPAARWPSRQALRRAGVGRRRPDRAADPQPLSRRPGELHRGRDGAGLGARRRGVRCCRSRSPGRRARSR